MRMSQKLRRVVTSSTTRLIVGCLASCALGRISDPRVSRVVHEKPCCR